MNKGERKFVITLLSTIMFCSVILIFKINSTKDYDQQLYEEIEQEYISIFENNNVTNKVITSAKTNTTNRNNYTSNSDYIPTPTIDKNSKVIASIMIPKLQKTYPVLSETTEEYLKIAPCKLAGGEPNEQGNFSIIGHNYNNSELFSNLNQLKKGDIVSLVSRVGNDLDYRIYDIYEIQANDWSCTKEETNGTTELTLITCTNNKNTRLVVKGISI